MHKRIKVITSHAGHARYFGELDSEIVGYIPRDRSIPSPYASGPNHAVWQDKQGRRVFIVETSHKRYEVFELAPGTPLYTDEQATELYIKSRANSPFWPISEVN